MIRRADPYRDTDVVDARAPRANQAAVAIFSLATVLTGFWPLVALYAAQLWIGLRFGRRWCLACVFYFEVLQPRIGEGPIEDARPPRFANQLGAVFLTVSTVAYATGFVVVGEALAGIVAALAALAATTGLCVGCEMYRIAARLRGIRAGRIDRVDLAELGTAPAGEIVVEFTHPLCTDCRTLEHELRAQGRQVLTVDVPTAVSVGPTGAVIARLA